MPSPSTAVIAAFALTVCASVPARAQARTDLLVAGARVRVHVPQSPAWATGRVDSLSSDTLYLTVDDGKVPARVARGDIARLEINTGHISRGATIARTVGVGALSGALIGTAAGVATGGSPRGCHEVCFTTSGVAAFGGLFGLVTGSAIGAFIGAVRPRPDRWTHVLLSPWGWTLTPAAH